MLELVEEPALPRGTWQFGQGTIHHHAFDVTSGENQQVVKNSIVGLGFTDETEEELRTHMCIPPHRKHRRAEPDQLEPIETEETVVG